MTHGRGPAFSGGISQAMRRGIILLLFGLVLAMVATVLVFKLTDASAKQYAANTALNAADMPLADTAYPVPRGAVFVAPDGDNRAHGTERDPLRTVRAAVDRVAPGGTVVLRQGTYRESVGTVRKQVTIQPYPHERAWLKGSVVVSGWQRTSAGWRHSGWDPDLCRNCHLREIIDSKYPYAGWPDMVFINSRPLRQVGSLGAVKPGTFYVDRLAHTLTVGDNPQGKLVESAAFDHLLQFDGPDAAGSSLRGLGIAQYGSNQEYGNKGAMVIANAPDVRLARNSFGFSASTGALVTQPGAVVKANRFLGNGLAGVVANAADNLRLTGNTFLGNNSEHFALSGPAIGAAGAKVTHTRRAFVADNYFLNNFATGWWCDLGCTDAVVVRNVAWRNDVHGIYYEVSSRALIASNVLADNRISGMKISSSDGVGIYQNTFTGNRVDLGLYNDPRSPSTDEYSARLGLSWVTERTTLLNNLFTGRDPGSPVIDSADYKDRPTPAPFVRRSDGNAFLHHGKQATAPLAIMMLGNGRAASFANLAQLRAGTGQDKASIEQSVGRPPFNDRAGGDFGLRDRAPGRAAGRPLPHPVATQIGVPATQRPDIGVLATPRRY